MSSISDLIKKEYERKFSDNDIIKKTVKKVNRKLTRSVSVTETRKMKRISLWLDKDLYEEVKSLREILQQDPLGKTYSREGELMRNIIRKGLPQLLSDFKKMFPHLKFSSD